MPDGAVAHAKRGRPEVGVVSRTVSAVPPPAGVRMSLHGSVTSPLAGGTLQ
jgi:hypothetical protein